MSNKLTGTVLGAALLVVVGLAGAAWAYWSATDSGAGKNSYAYSDSVGSGNTPTGSGAGSTITINWASTTTTAGRGVTGYLVNRYAAPTGGAATPAASGTCSATPVAALTCSESSVPIGTWYYTVTPVLGTQWKGAEGARSAGFSVAPTKLAFTTQPSATSSSMTAFAIQPQVSVQDASGNLIASDTSTVALTLTTPAGATLTCSGGTSKNVSAGVAVFAGCAVDKVGAYTLTATDGALSGAVSSSFTITVGAASKLVFSTQPSGSAASSTAFAVQPSVSIQDAGGNVVTSDTSSVTLALTTPGGAILTCTTNPKPAVSGVAGFAACKVDKVGAYTLTATDGALASAVSNSVSVTVGAAAKLAFTTQPSGSTGGVAFPTQPVVTVQDAGGNTVTSDTSPVTLALTSAGGATLTCTTNPKAAASGIASFAACKVDKTATYTLTATDGALSGAVSSSFTITVGAASKLVFSTQPSGSAASSTAFAVQPSVSIQDAGGNVVTSDTSSVTLALTTPGGAVLTCTTNPKPAVSGVAGFAACKVDKVGAYTLTATDGALASAVSNSVSITVGAAAKLVFTTQPSGSTGGVAFPTQPVVTVQDAGGNTVTSDTSPVTLALTSAGGATLTCTTNPKAAASGVDAFSGCLVDKAGTYTLTATDGALSGAVSSSFTITNGSARGITLTGSFSGGSAVAPTCSGTVGSLICNVNGATSGNSRSFGGFIALVDLGGNIVTNASGATITVSLTGTVSPSPSSLSILNGASTSSASFTEALGNGSGSRGYTATATVATVTVTVSGNGN